MIAIIDYGAGNLGSVHKAFRHLGADVIVTDDPRVVARAHKLVLPGVGAFAHCMGGLESIEMAGATKDFIDSGRPFLGICVGLQMLFDYSEEMGRSPGLSVLNGGVVRFSPDGRDGERLKIPHMGWNTLNIREDSVLFRGLAQQERVYFVHSFYPIPDDNALVSATSEYGVEFCCAVERDNLHAVQFHPEKSGEAGLRILRNFANITT